MLNFGIGEERVEVERIIEISTEGTRCYNVMTV